MSSRSLAVFLPSLAGGGAERMMLNLARGLAERGVPPDLVVADAGGPYRALVPSACGFVDLRGGRVSAALPGLVRYLRRRRPEVLLSAMDHANLIALAARGIARTETRVFVSVRSNLSQEAAHAERYIGRWIPYLARFAYPRAEAVIAVSRGVAEDLERWLGADRIRVQVIPNPVVTPELAQLAGAPVDHPWLRPGGPAVILAAGRLVPQKDYPTLLRAFAALPADRDLRLLILGEGPERGRLAALSRDLGLAERVDLAGFRDNPFAYMARARLFVLSSAWEGLPGVLIQAMACGTPVVSTDCPSGPREVLDEGRLGPLVQVGDFAALAAAMASVLDAPTAPERLRARASDFALDPVTRRYLEVFGLSDPHAAGLSP